MVRPLRPGGHPLHPLLVHFPVALWTVAVGADCAGLISGHALCWQISFGCQALGILIAVLAMVAGILDFAAMSREHPAQNAAVMHMMAMSTAWLLFVVSLAIRGSPAASPPPVWATIVAFAGFATMAFGGWLGGRLVYHFGVGVSDRA